MKRLLVFIFCLFLINYIYSQDAILRGYIYDFSNRPIQYANIVVNKTFGTTSNKSGYFELKVPSNTVLSVEISFISYTTFTDSLFLSSGSIHDYKTIKLQESINLLPETNVGVNYERHTSLQRLNPEISLKIPTMGGFEDILKTLPSVSSNNELSSQYNVRGGNFDENLVFVNDIEIYRPILIRSGQQEGLSFINSDMVAGIIFSAGGFESKYGDKMSSVLDIKYRKPNKFGGSASASRFGTNLHFEGTSKNHLFKYNCGLRYKTTKLVLSSLDEQGDYSPQYLDFQTYLSYDLNDKIEISFLSNINNNLYHYQPTIRMTSWGTINEALQIKIYSEGQELDKFNSFTNALTTSYRVNDNVNMKFILSSYHTNENENFDILSQYYLNELDNRLGSNNLGDSVINIGIGTYLDHARNNLEGEIYSFKHIGNYQTNNNKLQWGFQYNYEFFDYKIHEWKMIDSAGYSLPYIPSVAVPPNRSIISLHKTDMSQYSISSSRFNAYIQDFYKFSLPDFKLSLGGGLRFNYWTLNREFLISPRINCGIEPNWRQDVIFRVSTGIYHQAPFFKELRRLDGSINTNLKSQSSYHFVAGCDYEFKAWKRPFKLVTEIYYKYLNNLIPYNIDNLQIKYYGENMAHGYAMGIEAKVNGEFVPGTESWFSLGIMQTKEDIDGDYSVVKDSEGNIIDTTFYGLIPRLTDQRLIFGIYFQDYIPRYPSWQVYINLLFNTGLPFGPPNGERYMATKRYKAYRRVDIGISKKIFSNEDKHYTNFIAKPIQNIWISLEVFNLLNIKNEISHTWIKDIRGREYAIPNYLTARRLNVKILIKF